MGGRVFPGLNRRYEAKEYFDLVAELTPIFESISTVYNVCPAIGNKESFGDMDVLVVPKFPFNTDLLVAVFNLHCNDKGEYYVKRNGSSWSLIYKDFQIDLIVSPAEEYEFAKVYFGTGDRGNFVGKVAHQLGIKYGHDGMWMPIRLSDTHLLGEILLTRDPDRAERFLDIEPMRHANTIEEVFENVAASKYFNPESFSLENLNHISRVRDRKRPNYAKMIEWCKTLPPREYFKRNIDKTVYLDLIFAEFPEAKVEYEAMMERKRQLDEYKEKFNGDLVRRLTGLDGKELGDFMRTFKELYSIEDVLEMEYFKLYEAIAMHHHNQKVSIE